jgi:sigma-B regulation protein RsbU (phosphoserine phosphatase)
MFTGLKRRFIGLIILTCLATGIGGVIAFFLVMDNTVRDLRKAYAIQYTLLEKGRILAPIQREVALTMKMVDSPVLKAWILDENNPILKAQALKELESYRRHFQDQSWFFVLDPSKHFYFNNAKNEYEGKENRYTLKKENPDDQWYFATLQTVPDFDLNVDYDREVKETKLWINAVIRQGDHKLGIAGTGLTLERFLKEIMEKGRQDATTILIDRQGAVQAHPDESFIDHDSLAKKEDERSTIFRLLGSPDEAKRMRGFLDDLEQNPDSVSVANFDVEGKSYICAGAYIPEIQWYILTLLSRRGFINVGDFTPVAVLLIASLVIFVLVITFLLNRFVLNPITRLTRSTKEMTRGRYENVPQEQEGNEIGELIRSFNQMAKQVRDHTDHLERTVALRTADLSRTNTALTEKNHQIEQSIQYAEMIQRSVLSKPEDISKELPEFFLIWRPKDVVGGDFYYFRKTKTGFFLGLGDCTGHGVPGAFMNMTAIAALNHIVGSRPAMGPAAVLSALNQTLPGDSAAGSFW